MKQNISLEKRDGMECYSLTEHYDDGSSKNLDIEEVENGYVTTIRTEGKDSVTGEWKYNTKKYISKDNPIKRDTDAVEPVKVKDETTDIIDALKKAIGSF